MTQTTPPTHDDDLPDERELAALYARLPKVEPDAALDAAVLAEATRAMPVSRRPRWPVALASAAVLVLAASVAWQVRELQPAPGVIREAVPVATPQEAAKSIAAEAAPTPDLRKTASVGAASAANAGAAPAPNVGAASAAMPAPRAKAVRRAPPSVTAQVTATPATPPPPPEPPKPPAPPEPLAASQSPIVSTAPTVSAVPAPAPAPASAADFAPAQQHYEAAGSMPASKLLRKMPPSALGPDDRVGDIRRLLGTGDRAQAMRELGELRRRYPNYELPQDLRDLNP
jgi:Meckel syndrome type 1 protein